MKKLTECGNLQIHDYMRLNGIINTKDAKKHLVKTLLFQPERLSGETPGTVMRQSEHPHNV